MRHAFMVLAALVVLSVVAFGQGNQPIPTQGTDGLQGTHAIMAHGPHDFTPDSGAFTESQTLLDTTMITDSLGNPLQVIYNSTTSTVNHPHGTSTQLCGYCHAPHVPKDGIAVPLWARRSQIGKSFGHYQDANTISVTIADPGTSDNYSSFCLSCHDGSLGIFTASAYTTQPYGQQDTTAGQSTMAVNTYANVVNGEFDLQHVHPVNFDYNAAYAANTQGLYQAQNSTYKVWGGTYNGQNTTVRLFNGTMQCSSCHTPHMGSGIGLVYSGSGGKLCVACHKK